MNTRTIEQQVIDLLQYSQQQYATLQFETAYAYLYHHIGTSDALTVSAFTGSKLFWAWWRKQWSLRDEQYLAIVDWLPIDLDVYREIYADVHRAEEIPATPPVALVAREIKAKRAAYEAELQQKMRQLQSIISPKKETLCK